MALENLLIPPAPRPGMTLQGYQRNVDSWARSIVTVLKQLEAAVRALEADQN